MAKQKFEDNRVIDICGILDKDEDGEWIVLVEEESYSLSQYLDEMAGHEVVIKCKFE